MYARRKTSSLFIGSGCIYVPPLPRVGNRQQVTGHLYHWLHNVSIVLNINFIIYVHDRLNGWMDGWMVRVRVAYFDLRC